MGRERTAEIRPGIPCLDRDDATGGRQMHVVAYDFGIKQNILRMLARENCRVTVVPAQTSAEEVLAMQSRWHLLLEWPRRSRAARLRD